MSLNTVNMKTAEKYAKAAIQAGLVPFITGSPGKGKSKMIESIAKQANLKFVDIRLAQEDPTGLNGFPVFVEGNVQRSTYAPPVVYPLKGDPLPVKEGMEAQYKQMVDAAQGDKTKLKEAVETCCYSGWLINFDELPHAPRAVQNASFKILLDRKIGEAPLHSRCYLAAAGNLSTDNAGTNEIVTPLKSRIIHIKVDSNAQDYIKLGAKLGFDTRVLSYLAYKNDSVNNFEKFNAGSSDETFACERTWEFVSKLLGQISPNQASPIDDEWADLLAGTVGSVAYEFVTFTHAFKDLPTIEEILKNPTTAMIPDKPAVRWLLTGMLVGHAKMDNIDVLMDYINRLPKEFIFVAVKMLWGKADEFLSNPKVEAAFSEIGDLLLG